jgi:hypothetical protein
MKIKNPELKFPKRNEKICERWYGPEIQSRAVHRCTNKAIYQSDITGACVCRFCAREIYKWNKNQEFTRIWIDDKN